MQRQQGGVGGFVFEVFVFGVDAGAGGSEQEADVAHQIALADAVVEIAPALRDRIEIGGQCHRQRHQLRRGPVEQHVELAQCVGVFARQGAAERVGLRDQLHQAVQQRTCGAEQQEPEQHAEPARECGAEHGVDQAAAIKADRWRGRIGGNVLQRGEPRIAVGRVCHRADVGVQIARAPAIEQHRGREQKGRETVGDAMQQELQHADQQHQESDRPEAAEATAPQAAAGQGIEVAAQPAFEPAVMPQAAELRQAVAEDDRDKYGE